MKARYEARKSALFYNIRATLNVRQTKKKILIKKTKEARTGMKKRNEKREKERAEKRENVKEKNAEFCKTRTFVGDRIRMCPIER